MKRLVIVAAIVLALGLVAGTGMAASQEPPDGDFDLAITQVKPNPPDPTIGQNVLFQVSYANRGPAPVPDGLTVAISLTLMTTAQEPVGIPCIEEAPGASGLDSLASNVHGFTTCDFLLPLEGDYSARAEFVTTTSDPAVAPQERVYETLADRDAGNNHGFSEAFHVGPAETALPDELGRLFAGLGMFAAVMAIMAVGTEVVIDTFKVFLGMKRKVTALDSLERLEKLMPGQLAALGVGAAEQESFKKLTANLKATLQDSLKPINNLTQIKQAMASGHYKEAVDALDALVAGVTAGTTATQQIDKLKAEAIKVLLEKTDQLANDEIAARLKNAINGVTATNANQLLENIAAALDQDWAAILSEEWLTKQRDLLLQEGRSDVIELFEQKVKPQLAGLGLNPDLLAAARGQLDLALMSIEVQAKQATDTYIASLGNLLDAVEAQRYAMQSPMRKIWRRLRQASHGEKFLALILGLLDAIILWLVNVPILVAQPPFWQRTLTAILGGLLAAVVYWLILLLLARWGESLYRGKLQEAMDKAITDKDGPKQTEIRLLVDTIVDLTHLQKVEYLWNHIRGQKVIDPAKFDVPPKVEELLQGIKLSATTVAQVVLARTDQQQDEESSRLRWLRVISAVIGLYLAYLLQIDAAKLLDAAVPGISNIINGILNLSGEQLHNFWPIFLPDRALTAGIILTGLAASAGSTFWHDQLDRLQSAKAGAESAARLLKQAKQQLGGSPEEQ